MKRMLGVAVAVMVLPGCPIATMSLVVDNNSATATVLQIEILASDGRIYSGLVGAPVAPGETREFVIPRIPPGTFVASVTLLDALGVYTEVVSGSVSPQATGLLYTQDKHGQPIRAL